MTEEEAKLLVEDLVNQGIVNWKEVATAILGCINPPQVGTSIASHVEVKNLYGKRKTWQAVKSWLYEQPRGCRQCGTLFQLEAEHIRPKAEGGDVHRLDNLQLLCKRCNAIKRPSHKNAGITPLPTGAALMWILLTQKPETYEKYERLCREYGLTMASIRFQEAWVMAYWLAKAKIKIERTGRVSGYVSSEFVVTMPNSDKVIVWSEPWIYDKDKQSETALKIAQEMWSNRSYDEN